MFWYKTVLEASQPKIEIFLVDPDYKKTYDQFFVNRVMVYTRKYKGFEYTTRDDVTGGTVFPCQTNVEYKPRDNHREGAPQSGSSAVRSSTPSTNREPNLSTEKVQYDLLSVYSDLLKEYDDDAVILLVDSAVSCWNELRGRDCPNPSHFQKEYADTLAELRLHCPTRSKQFIADLEAGKYKDSSYDE